MIYMLYVKYTQLLPQLLLTDCYVCLLGYAGGAYAFNGLGGSTELECLPSPLPQSGNFLTSYTNARVMNATFYLGMLPAVPSCYYNYIYNNKQ